MKKIGQRRGSYQRNVVIGHVHEVPGNDKIRKFRAILTNPRNQKYRGPSNSLIFGDFDLYRTGEHFNIVSCVIKNSEQSSYLYE